MFLKNISHIVMLPIFCPFHGRLSILEQTPVVYVYGFCYLGRHILYDPVSSLIGDATP